MVPAGEGGEPEARGGREVGVAHRVVALRGLYPLARHLVHRPKESGGQGAVGVDDQDGVERFATGDELIEEPVQCRALARVVRSTPLVDRPATPSHDCGGVV